MMVMTQPACCGYGCNQGCGSSSQQACLMTIRKSPERKRKRSKERRVHHEEDMQMPTMQRQDYDKSDGYAKEEIEKMNKKIDHLKSKVEHLENRKPTTTVVTEGRSSSPRDMSDYDERISHIEDKCKHFKKEIEKVEDECKKNGKHIHKLEEAPSAPKAEKAQKVEDHSHTIKR
jgi:prefoldin subunit 5